MQRHHQSLDDLDSRGGTERRLGKEPIALLVHLKPRRLDGGSFGAIEDATVNGTGIGRAPHEPTERIDLVDEVALGHASHARIAWGLTHGRNTPRDDAHAHADSLCCKRSFQTGMTGTDHQDRRHRADYGPPLAGGPDAAAPTVEAAPGPPSRRIRAATGARSRATLPLVPGFVSIVGAGPWNPELLTLAGLRRLQRAEVVIADYLANPNLLFHAPPGAEIVQRERGPGGGPRLRQPELNDLMVEYAKSGRYVVRLKGGDPCLFGRGGEEAQVLREAGIDFEFVPGVSSPIAAPEAAGIPITHRDHTPAVTFVSGYEAYDKAGLHVEWGHLARSAGTLILMMSVKNARDNAQRLIAAGRHPNTPAAVIRWGTRGIQRTVVAELSTIADRIEEEGIRAPSILVVGEVVHLRDQLRWFDTRPLFGRRIVVTRSVVQAQPLLQALVELGADPLLLPCLQCDPPADPDDFLRAVADVDAYDGVILSSTNGVDAYFDALERAGRDLRALAGRQVATIGPSTSEACRRRGIRPDIEPREAHSEGLAGRLRSQGQLGARWLHVRGDAGRTVLGEAIHAAGGSYRLAIGYRLTRPQVPESVVRSLLTPEEGGEDFDAVCLASAKTAEHFLETLAEVMGHDEAKARVSRRQIVALGPVTARALEAMDLPVAAIADEPSDEGLVSALRTMFGA